MNTKLTREQIEKLNGLADTDKDELLNLFVDAEKADEEIQKLRKAQPTDSQLIVEKTNYAAMEKAVSERDGKISVLEKRLNDFSVGFEADDLLGAFAPVFALFTGK